MTKRYFASACLLAALCYPSMASAQVFSPPGTVVLTGNVTNIQGGGGGTCLNLQFTMNVTGTTAQIVSNNSAQANLPGGPTCAGGLVPRYINNPWNVTIETPAPGATGPATRLRISNVAYRSTRGLCGPQDIVVNWNNSTGTLDFAGAVVGGQRACTITGTLSSSPQLSASR